MGQSNKRWRKPVYIVLGTLTLGLGALGLFLPVLPTTPLWLLTAYLYMHSSPELYQRAMSNRLFGGVVRNFQLYRAIPLRSKIIIMVVLWGGISLSCYAVAKLWLTILLLLTALCISIHVLSYPTLTLQLRKEKEEELAHKNREQQA